jgi:hypothetical protein
VKLRREPALGILPKGPRKHSEIPRHIYQLLTLPITYSFNQFKISKKTFFAIAEVLGKIGVLTNHGWTELTVTPVPFSFSAKVSAAIIILSFELLYVKYLSKQLGCGQSTFRFFSDKVLIKAKIEPVKTILPEADFFSRPRTTHETVKKRKNSYRSANASRGNVRSS